MTAFSARLAEPEMTARAWPYPSSPNSMSQNSPTIVVGRPFDAAGHVICTKCYGPTVKLTVKKFDSANLGRIFYKCQPDDDRQQCTSFVWDDQVQVQRQRLGVPDPDSPSPTSGTAPTSVHGSSGSPRTPQRATAAPPHFASQPTTAPEPRRTPLRTQRSEPVTTFQHHLSEEEDAPSHRAPSIAPTTSTRSSVTVPSAPSRSGRPTSATAGSSAPDTDPGNDTEVTEHATDDDYQSITRRSRRLPPQAAAAPAPTTSKSKGKSRMPGTFTDSTPSSGTRTSVGTTGHIRAWVREVSSEDVFGALPTQDGVPSTPPRASTSGSSATRLHGLATPSSPSPTTVRLSGPYMPSSSQMSTSAGSPSSVMSGGPYSPTQSPVEALDEMIQRRDQDTQMLVWMRRRLRAYEKIEEFKLKNGDKLRDALAENAQLRDELTRRDEELTRLAGELDRIKAHNEALRTGRRV